MSVERVFFVTNRDPIHSGRKKITGFREGFQSIAPGWLRVGHCDVTLRDGDAEPVWTGQRLTVYDDALTMAATRALAAHLRPADGGPAPGSARFFADLEALVFPDGVAAGPARDVLFYIHGYDTEFDEAMGGAAQMQRNYNNLLKNLGPVRGQEPRPLQLVVLTWPSNGATTRYWGDREIAEASKWAVSRSLAKLQDYLDALYRHNLAAALGGRQAGARAALEARYKDIIAAAGARTGLVCGVRIHLMAQSMGNFVLRHGLQDFRRGLADGQRLPMLFDQIVLTGADEEDEAFDEAELLGPLPQLGRRVTVYFNRQDQALLVSRTTKHLSDRLGLGGPASGNTEQVVAVNVSRVAFPGTVPADPYGHFYNRVNPTVQTDILHTLGGADRDAVPGRALVQSGRYYLL